MQMTSRELVTKLAIKMKKEPNYFDKHAERLEKELYDTAWSLYDMDQHSWDVMNIPLLLSSAIE